MVLKRLAAWCLALACVLCMMTAAQAEGLDVSVTTDKKSYTHDEVATLTIRIENNTDRSALNLKIQNFIPTGLKYVKSTDAEQTIGELKPGASVERKIRVLPVDAELPDTGDHAMPLLWISLGLAGTAGLILLVWRRRRA